MSKLVDKIKLYLGRQLSDKDLEETKKRAEESFSEVTEMHEIRYNKTAGDKPDIIIDTTYLAGQGNGVNYPYSRTQKIYTSEGALKEERCKFDYDYLSRQGPNFNTIVTYVPPGRLTGKKQKV
ncbi:TPA: hypothetical protein HA235_00055 [Candidatus Woesearchaeota archaeon]|nr:hypothetical protein [Candidatus Woesearchaeota archaeon]HIH31077.1 hypothetical protein [Candidatus Woesearchaeota archaeon]HIH55295.1 hypothetical protein [Candidatus Woesearchaeota archaeon]HIJ01538.1 hypothetical protein [Candidatus Woesearchaeota archaeon]HIJ13842.1 hypothetical protein [Candidatus Woesearchaeota archaeon]